MPCSALCAECHLALTYVTTSGTTDSQCIENRRVCPARRLLDGGGDGGGKGEMSQKAAGMHGCHSPLLHMSLRTPLSRVLPGLMTPALRSAHVAPV